MTLLKRAAKDGKKFLNPVPTTVGGFSTMRKVLPEYLKNRAETEPKQPLGPFFTDTSIYATPSSTGLRITWFGHSSLLIEIDNHRILVDPIWEQRASPVQWLGPKRFFAPTMRLEDLPQLDAVLISHDHYDHFGAHTLRKLATLPNTQHARWITSLGVGKRLRKLGVAPDRTTELDWTQSATVGGLTITSWPTRHFSGRGLFDRFQTLWASFVLEGPKHRVYFGADSGFWDGYAEMAAQYPAGFDLTLLEIGAFHPLWAGIHLGPDGAAAAYRAMGGFAHAGLLMPIHWALFNLALHAWRQPIERLLELDRLGEIDRSTPSASRLWLPTPGQPTDVTPANEVRSTWWK
jgi:L-ascorbate metabolism protein UlaG (beta-lactamase superfamily)